MGHETGSRRMIPFKSGLTAFFRMARKFSGMAAHREKMARYERKMTVI